MLLLDLQAGCGQADTRDQHQGWPLPYRLPFMITCCRSSVPALQGGPSTSANDSRQWNETGATCLACGIGVTAPGFQSAQEQRSHFKSE
jgi:hypothetical protein